MDGYVRRVIDDELDQLLPELPAVALEGARGVGKTSTASRRARTFHRLDDDAVRAVVAADLDAALAAPAPVLLDEWQRVPALWDRTRRAVDDGATGGSFILTGSLPPVEQPVHSGAGRVVPIRMRPLSLCERGLGESTVSMGALLAGGRPDLRGNSEIRLSDYVGEILRSGFPGLRASSGRALRARLDAYLERVAMRDYEDAGFRVRSPDALLRWMRAYAAATASTATFETIRRAASPAEGVEPARSTVLPYRDALSGLYILDPVPGWAPTRNRVSRLSLAPKHHLVDPALAARLLGVDEADLLSGRGAGASVGRDGSLLGALFESLVAQSVRVYAQNCEAHVGHLRTRGGRQEIDLIVERGTRVLAIEVKLGQVPDDGDVRHLHWLADQLGENLVDALVVTSGPHAYRRADGIGVVPAALLGP